MCLESWKELREKGKKRGNNGEVVTYFELFSTVLITLTYMGGVMEL